jgi:hypothetical protein
VNHFEPLKLLSPPCSFALLNSGPDECKRREEQDHFGLCTPCSWDCMTSESVRVDYFSENFQPSRKAACNCYCYSKQGRGRNPHHRVNSCDAVYFVDDKMEQVIMLLQAINTRTSHFTSLEVGSRQGQWVLKAVALAKRMGTYESVHGHSVELQETWRSRQAQKIKRNWLQNEVTLSGTAITAENYPELIHNLTMRTGSWQPINHISWDCQGCEELLATPEAFKLYKDNVLHLFITLHPWHSEKKIRQVVQTYEADTLIYERGSYACDAENKEAIHNNNAGFQVNFRGNASVLNDCIRDMPGYGPVHFRDGSLRVFNRGLYNKLGLKLRLPHCEPWRPDAPA